MLAYPTTAAGVAYKPTIKSKENQMMRSWLAPLMMQEETLTLALAPLREAGGEPKSHHTANPDPDASRRAVLIEGLLLIAARPRLPKTPLRGLRWGASSATSIHQTWSGISGWSMALQRPITLLILLLISGRSLMRLASLRAMPKSFMDMRFCQGMVSTCRLLRQIFARDVLDPKIRSKDVEFIRKINELYPFESINENKLKIKHILVELP
jgi:hypothetical protein